MFDKYEIFEFLRKHSFLLLIIPTFYPFIYFVLNININIQHIAYFIQKLNCYCHSVAFLCNVYCILWINNNDLANKCKSITNKHCWTIQWLYRVTWLPFPSFVFISSFTFSYCVEKNTEDILSWLVLQIECMMNEFK